MNLKIVIFLLNFVNMSVGMFFDIEEVMSNKLTRLPRDFSRAIKDIAIGIPTRRLIVVQGNTTNIRSEQVYDLFCQLNEKNIQVINLDIKTKEIKDLYYGFLKKALDISDERTSLVLCEPSECEAVLKEISDNNLIHRTILYIFFWPHGSISQEFLSIIKEATRVAVITNPRESVYRIYYNQAASDRLHHLSLVNWWSGRLYKSPALPPVDKVYRNFNGRVFDVPVLHAPPWHFVNYNNDSSINVTGGRDDKLLSLIAKKLNFRYRYYDPPERSQGSSISGNGTFKGTLGLIWKRKAEFFLGDVTMTWERLQAVEFTFLTLADSGAFLTHAPAKLSETLAIIRPFRWEVWPLVCATILVTGPALWVVIAAPSLWQRRSRNQLDLLNKCCWFTTTLFLRQSSSKEPSNTHKARLVSVLISLGATYVIADMYSANLTSLLARPAREQPIGTLQALEEAMRDQGYELVVERHSSSLSMLQNGTGVYGRLARLMRRQKVQRVRSIETGVRMVLSRRHVAVLGGRETLYYDTERFGTVIDNHLYRLLISLDHTSLDEVPELAIANGNSHIKGSHNFHLSEKLNTRYSAIAMQVGSPYLETFNNVLMTLFEAGILTKMTTDEYKNLPEHSRRSDKVTEGDRESNEFPGDSAASTAVLPSESTKGLQPVTLRMFQGAFCLLGIGYLLAVIALATEIQMYRKGQRGHVISGNTNVNNNRGVIVMVKRSRLFIKESFHRIMRVFYAHIDGALAPEHEF